MDHNSDNRIVFDIESKKTFDEVGGYENKEELGVSYVGVYSYSQKKEFGFWENELENLEKILIAEKPMLIGFNSVHFDVPVLQPYMKKLKLIDLPQHDILQFVEKSLGHRLKLDSIAEATLYSKKSGTGLDAIRYYREGDYESLARYCLKDVEITRDIYEYGLRHGRLLYPTGGEYKLFDIAWGQSPTIPERLEQAFKKHEQLDIEYFEVDEEGKKETVKRTIEILSFEGERFEAFCHNKNGKTKFLVSRVWDIEETGSTFVHQGSLFS